MKIHSISNERITLSVCETGASITELSYINASGRRLEVLRGYSEAFDSTSDFNPLLSAMFPMVPFVNRIKGNSFELYGKKIDLPTHHLDSEFYLHGDGWINDWHVTKNNTTIYCYFESHIKGICHYSARQEISLVGNEVNITLTIKNLGMQEFPYGIGLHPYFRCEYDSLLSFSPEGVWLEQHDHLPGDYLDVIPEHLSFCNTTVPDFWINNCYSFPENVNTSITHRNGMQVCLASDSKYMMVFKPSREDEFICLEPQTQMLDAHNHNAYASLKMLAQNEELSLSVSIKINEIQEVNIGKVSTPCMCINN